MASATYKTKCIQCHSVDPRHPGSLGPELVTTPREVFHSKILTGTYPKGYKAKRKTKLMPKFKLTPSEIDKLVDYVQRFKK